MSQKAAFLSSSHARETYLSPSPKSHCPSLSREEGSSAVSGSSGAEERPAWLWDVDRQKIVWANASAVTFFGGETLFDLLDRSFPPSSSYASDLLSFFRSSQLPRSSQGESLPSSSSSSSSESLLSLALPGMEGKTPCFCSITRLANNRFGVFIRLESDLKAPSPPSSSIVSADFFDYLPFSAIIVNETGAVLKVNAEARNRFSLEEEGDVFHLFPLDVLTSLVKGAGCHCLEQSVVTVLSEEVPRDLKVTARALPHAREHNFLLILEDVTERRALERFLSSSQSYPPPYPGAASAFSQKEAAQEKADKSLYRAPWEQGLTPEETKTFETLGMEILKDFQTSSFSPSVCEQDTLASDYGSPKAIAPPLIQSPIHFENSSSAILLCQDGQIIYANPEATKLLKYPSPLPLLSRHDIAEKLSTFPNPSGVVSLIDGYGVSISLGLRLSPLAIPNGHLLKVELFTRQSQGTSSFSDSPFHTLHDGPLPKASSQQRQDDETSDAPSASCHGLIDGILTLDAFGMILSCSPGIETLLERTQQEILNRHICEFIAAQGAGASLREGLDTLLHGRSPLFSEGRDVVAIASKGKHVPLFMTIAPMTRSSPVRSYHRGMAVFCAVLRNTPDWKRTEEELRKAKEKAERENTDKSLFLARMSHELRTPLNAILGFSEMMRTERFGKIQNPKYLDYAHDIHSSGEHLLALINDLLDLSKIESGKFDLEKQTLNLEELCETCVRLVEEQANRKDISLKRTYADGLPLLFLEERSMKQILLNLLSNSVKFTLNGGKINLSLSRGDEESIHLVLEDTGVGMTDEEMALALTPFGRTAFARKSDAQGTGLGLPLAKALMEAQGGSLSLSSTPQKGTRVTLLFPKALLGT